MTYCYSTKRIAQCYVAAWVGGREEWIHEYIWLVQHVPETITHE